MIEKPKLKAMRMCELCGLTCETEKHNDSPVVGYEKKSVEAWAGELAKKLEPPKHFHEFVANVENVRRELERVARNGGNVD